MQIKQTGKNLVKYCKTKKFLTHLFIVIKKFDIRLEKNIKHVLKKKQKQKLTTIAILENMTSIQEKLSKKILIILPITVGKNIFNIIIIQIKKH